MESKETNYTVTKSSAVLSKTKLALLITAVATVAIATVVGVSVYSVLDTHSDETDGTCFTTPDPADATLFNRSLTSYSAGSVLVFECTAGYELENGDGSLRCINGSWHGSVNCTDETDGTCFTTPDPADATLFNRSLTSYSAGSVLVFECTAGYELENGDGSLRCINGSWHGSVNCTEAEVTTPCTTPPTPSNAVLVTTPSSSYDSGHVLLYNCSSGYLIDDAHDRFTCQPNGMWSGTVSCIAVTCTSPATPPNGVLWNTTSPPYSYGDSLAYTCQSGYEIKDGQDHVICQADTTWAGTVTCQATCYSCAENDPCPGSPPLFPECRTNYYINCIGGCSTVQCQSGQHYDPSMFSCV